MSRILDRLFLPVDNCSMVASKFFYLLKVKARRAKVEDYVLLHPDHPSLLSISDALKNWGIPHVALKSNNRKLIEMPTPFIAQIIEDGKPYFCVISALGSKKVTLFNRSLKKRKVSIETFTKDWTGVALFAEAKERSIDSEFQTEYNRAKFIAFLFFIICIAFATWVLV